MKGVIYSHNVAQQHHIINKLHAYVFSGMLFEDGLITTTDQKEGVGSQQDKWMVEKKKS